MLSFCLNATILKAQTKAMENPKQSAKPISGSSKTFRGKELTDDQHKDFKAGQTIYIDGLKDKKGQLYQRLYHFQ